MITVREMCKLLLMPKEIVVTMDGRNYELLPENRNNIDAMLMLALGDYIVADVQACEEDCFAIDVLMEPVKSHQ